MSMQNMEIINLLEYGLIVAEAAAADSWLWASPKFWECLTGQWAFQLKIPFTARRCPEIQRGPTLQDGKNQRGFRSH